MRPRINWFSPLPDARTDIAHYSARVIPALAARADVTLWTTQDSWSDAIAKVAPVIRWSLAGTDWKRLNAADINVYNIGNNPHFHHEIVELARICPGLCVMHDVRIHHLLHHALPRADYLRAMAQYYGMAGVDAVDRLDARQTTVHDLAPLYPLTGYAIENAAGILVHNRAVRAMASVGGTSPAEYLPLPYQSGAPPRPPSRNGRIRLVQYGYLNVNRQIDKVLDALAGLEDREEFQLDIYGDIWDPAMLARWIAERGLEKVVQVHGFVTDAALDIAIQDAELVLNLRWPSMGEASGSQMRAWNAGRASLVTNTEWYATLSPRAVFFVDPVNEVADLQRHFRALREHPETYWASGAEGRAILETSHDPVRYADGLLSIAQAAIERRETGSLITGNRLGNAIAGFTPGMFPPAEITRVAERLATLRRSV